jgi:hypothetical protein
MIAKRLELESDQEASYAALSAEVAAIVSVAGLPPSSCADGRAVTRPYAAALRTPSFERWRALSIGQSWRLSQAARPRPRTPSTSPQSPRARDCVPFSPKTADAPPVEG